MYVEQQDIALAVRAKQKASGGAADQGKQPTRSRALVSQASLNFMLFEQATRSSQGTLSGDQLGGEHSELACAQAETRDTKTSKRTRVPCLASPAPQHHSQPVPQARPHARHFCTCPCAALHLREQGGAAERDAAKARSLIPLLPALRSVVRVRLSHQGHRRCTLGGKGFVCVYRVCTECRAKRFCEACVSFCSLLSVGVVATSVNMSSFLGTCS
jgi:hypothetical protein